MSHTRPAGWRERRPRYGAGHVGEEDRAGLCGPFHVHSFLAQERELGKLLRAGQQRPRYYVEFLKRLGGRARRAHPWPAPRRGPADATHASAERSMAADPKVRPEFAKSR